MQARLARLPPRPPRSLCVTDLAGVPHDPPRSLCVTDLASVAVVRRLHHVALQPRQREEPLHLHNDKN